jgi:lipopolysaccharide export LptBFGC system permease protein LptF
MAAAIKKNDKDKKDGKYIIIPRNQDTYNEVFAVANMRRLPFETPVTLSSNDVKALENQKEAFQADKKMTVYEAMEKYQVDQKKAAQIVQAQAQHPDIGGKVIKWRSKYILQPV